MVSYVKSHEAVLTCCIGTSSFEGQHKTPKQYIPTILLMEVLYALFLSFTCRFVFFSEEEKWFPVGYYEKREESTYIVLSVSRTLSFQLSYMWHVFNFFFIKLINLAKALPVTVTGTDKKKKTLDQLLSWWLLTSLQNSLHFSES